MVLTEMCFVAMMPLTDCYNSETAIRVPHNRAQHDELNRFGIVRIYFRAIWLYL